MKKTKLSKEIKMGKKKLLILIICLIYIPLHAQKGLQYSEEEIRIWRQRAGLDSGQ